MNVRCPKCGKVRRYEGNPHRPFCSERCRLLDLYAWMEGEYIIAGQDSGKAEDESGPPEEGS